MTRTELRAVVTEQLKDVELSIARAVVREQLTAEQAERMVATMKDAAIEAMIRWLRS